MRGHSLNVSYMDMVNSQTCPIGWSSGWQVPSLFGEGDGHLEGGNFGESIQVYMVL